MAPGENKDSNSLGLLSVVNKQIEAAEKAKSSKPQAPTPLKKSFKPIRVPGNEIFKGLKSMEERAKKLNK